MQASDGKLYGMTWAGGSNGRGVIFSFDLLSSTFTKLKDYNGANGASPYVGSAFIEVTSAENKAPTVSITNPANVTIYVAPALIPLIADANDLDGTIKKVEFYNGTTLLRTEKFAPYSWNWVDVPVGNYTITAKAYDNNGGITTSAPVHIFVVPNKPPTVNIINPLNGQTMPGPLSIILEAAAGDRDGSITKVELYNGETLLRTENFTPYSWNWKDVPVGNYIIMAKAYDNSGGVTTSAPVNISIVPNKPPAVSIINPVTDETIAGPTSIILEAASEPVHFSVLPNKPPSVSITNPVNGQVIMAPASINLEAAAGDPDGRITKVQFYNGETLLHNEYYAPYTYNWQYAHAGNYTITARATDDLGKVTTSEPVSITITSPNESIAGRQSYVNNNTDIHNAISVKLFPNPTKDILNIYTTGLDQNKKLIISVVSVSGVTVKTVYIIPDQIMQMDVSSLKPGVYFLKAASGDRVLYTQFVKL